MTLNEQEQRRLLQTLQDDPVFLAQVRSLILSDELVQLPERFAQFVSRVTVFIERQEKFNARQEETNARQEEINARVDNRLQRITDDLGDLKAHVARQEEFNARQEEFNARVDNRLQRITDDLGDLKGNVAGRAAREMVDDIAEHFGFEVIQQLNGNDLRVMLRQQKPNDIPPGVRRSFYLADVVAKVEAPDGNQLYIAVEASYTADERDTRRAIRNAGFITRFTGIDALPVIASRDNDYAVQQMVDDGAIRWFQFEAGDLQPQ